MGKKVGSISPAFKKKLKQIRWSRKYPLRYIDKGGSARAAPGGKKVPKRRHIKLGGTKLTRVQLKARKALKKIFYITKAGTIMEAKSGLGRRRRRVKRKTRRKSRRRSR